MNEATITSTMLEKPGMPVSGVEAVLQGLLHHLREESSRDYDMEANSLAKAREHAQTGAWQAVVDYGARADYYRGRIEAYEEMQRTIASMIGIEETA